MSCIIIFPHDLYIEKGERISISYLAFNLSRYN